MSLRGGRGVEGVPLRWIATRKMRSDSDVEPSHTLKVLRLARPGLTPEVLAAHVSERLPEVRVLHRTYHDRPLSPGWWREELPAASDHVEERRVDDGEDAFDAALGALMSERLPGGRPPWRLVLLRAPSAQWVVLAASHGLLDGRLASLTLESLFGTDDTAVPVWPDERRSVPGPLQDVGALAAAAGALVPRLVATARRRRTEDATPMPGAYAGDPAPWNARLVSARRGATTLAVPLADWEAVRRTTGGSFTELALAVCAEATGRLAPGVEKLVAVVPVDVRAATDSPTAVNHLTFAFVCSPTASVPLRERVAAAGEALRAGRVRIAGDPQLFPDLWDVWPLMATVHRLSAVIGRRIGRPATSYVVSTVRGPTRWPSATYPSTRLPRSGSSSGTRA